MSLFSKRTSLVILGISSVVFSRTIFWLLDDSEGTNLLIVAVLAAVVFGISSVAYLRTVSLVRKFLLAFFTQVLIALGLGLFFSMTYSSPSVDSVSGTVPSEVVPSPVVSSEDFLAGASVTERYQARVDRVDVVFEQADYTRYRLQTNDLVRTGELNTERGFEDDPDATVYVLNWQQPEGQQIYYVRLTSDSTHLYYLDSERKVIPGSALTLVK